METTTTTLGQSPTQEGAAPGPEPARRRWLRRGALAAGAVLAVLALLLALGAVGSRLDGTRDAVGPADWLSAGVGEDAAESPILSEPGAARAEQESSGLPTAAGPDIAITAQASITAPAEQGMASASDAVAALAAVHGARIAAQSGHSGGIPSGIVDDDPSTWYLTVRLRVPPANTDALLADLDQLGTVTSSDRTDEDLTAAVADTASRVESARISLARVQALMAQATTLDEVLRLEQELSVRQADLDAQLATAAALADRTTEADVTLTISGTSDPGVAADDDGNSFLTGWNAGVDLLLAGLSMVAAATGFLLPFVPLLLVAAVLGWLAWHRVRRSRSQAA